MMLLMNTLNTNIVLSVRPKEYLVQGPSHCGAYCVKAILSAYGKDDKNHPKEYHTNFFCRLTGSTLSKSYYPNILKRYGIHAESKTAKDLSNRNKIDLLKNLLCQNTPVMIRIGNGYFRSNIYNPLLGKIVTHWITLWGYDDKEKLFYVYDSGLTKNLYGKNVPIGNARRTYNEILRDWNFGNWQPWTWHVSPQNYSYIKISN